MSNKPKTSEIACNSGEPSVDYNEGDKTIVKSEGQSLVSQRMTIAGVFFDIALFVADVEHLKFVIDEGKETLDNYALLLGLLIGSLSIQILVGVLLFVRGFKQDSDPEDTKSIDWTKVIDNIIVGLVSVIALINILVTVFGDRTESVANYRATHNCSG